MYDIGEFEIKSISETPRCCPSVVNCTVNLGELFAMLLSAVFIVQRL